MSIHSERWKDNAATLGANIKRLREREGMNLTRLSECVGISKSYLHAIENGVKSAPSVFVAYDLAVALGTSIEELLGLPADAGTARGEVAKVKASEVVELRRKLARIRSLCDGQEN